MVPPMIKDKKKKQLGMDPGTAGHRLRIDLLFRFIECLAFKCFRCKGDLSREDFSIDHKEPWIDSEDPVGLFFDLKNVAFSHKSCNYKAARSARKKHSSKEEVLAARAERQKRWRKNNPEKYSKRRREKYLRTGT